MGRKCRKERMVTDAFGKIALAPTSIGGDLHFVQDYSGAVKWLRVLCQGHVIANPISSQPTARCIVKKCGAVILAVSRKLRYRLLTEAVPTSKRLSTE